MYSSCPQRLFVQGASLQSYSLSFDRTINYKITINQWNTQFDCHNNASSFRSILLRGGKTLVADTKKSLHKKRTFSSLHKASTSNMVRYNDENAVGLQYSKFTWWSSLCEYAGFLMLYKFRSYRMNFLALIGDKRQENGCVMLYFKSCSTGLRKGQLLDSFSLHCLPKGLPLFLTYSTWHVCYYCETEFVPQKYYYRTYSCCASIQYLT